MPPPVGISGEQAATGPMWSHVSDRSGGGDRDPCSLSRAHDHRPTRSISAVRVPTEKINHQSAAARRRADASDGVVHHVRALGLGEVPDPGPDVPRLAPSATNASMDDATGATFFRSEGFADADVTATTASW